MWTDSLPAEPQGKPKDTGVGSLSLLQWIFPTQESNRGLLHCRRILYQPSYQGSPILHFINSDKTFFYYTLFHLIKKTFALPINLISLLTNGLQLTLWKTHIPKVKRAKTDITFLQRMWINVNNFKNQFKNHYHNCCRIKEQKIKKSICQEDLSGEIGAEKG